MTRWLVVIAMSGLLLGAACSSSGEESSNGGSDNGGSEAPFEINAEPVATTEVDLPKSYKFEPEAISVEAGEEVTWTNNDDFPHNVHLLDGSDVTEDLPVGESAAMTFDDPGEFYYECSIHPDQMQGKIVVN